MRVIAIVIALILLAMPVSDTGIGKPMKKPAEREIIAEVQTEAAETEAPAETEPAPTYCGIREADINRMASVLNGEVGSMCGDIWITYYDGTQAQVSGDTIRMIHARVLLNQYYSARFPSTISGCICRYWSSAYDCSDYRSSAQWARCRQNVIDAIDGGVYVPSNVFGATQDSNFGCRYDGYWQWARVDWNTGWNHGTFYYYAYN